jgi:hypothetical protein
MSRLNEGLSVDQLTAIGANTDKGRQVLDIKQVLETLGVDGKDIVADSLATPSVITFEKGEALSRKQFFTTKNPVSSLPNIDFPLRTHGLEISMIRADLDLNLGATAQASLEKEYYFLKNSSLKIMINHNEGPVIPLEHCVPYVIEEECETSVAGSVTTTSKKLLKKIVKDGYELPAPILLGIGGDLEVSLDPAPGYTTDATAANADPVGPNSIRLALMGRKFRVKM